MKILVTGGAGFIGSNLVNTLLKQQNEITVIDNLSTGYLINIHRLNDINFIKGDICDEILLNKLMPGTDVIYHLASSVGNKRSIDMPHLDAQSNAIGTLTLLESARKANVKKIIVSSSAGIFGELKILPIKEDHPIEPRTPYGSSKLYAEKLALSYNHLYGIEIVCLRYFNVYGINQRFDTYGSVIPIFVHQILNNTCIKIYGDGEQTRDFVNVADVVQANIKASQYTGIAGAYNIGSGTSISINQFVKELKMLFGTHFNIEYTDKRKGDVSNSLADIAAAKQAFNFSPKINLRDGLQSYIEWIKSSSITLASSIK